MLAPFFRNLISPDQSLTRALNLRLGVRYVGTLGNRLQAQWQLGEADSFAFRYRGRFQLQREFDLGQVGLTPW
jgi:hypothetical protein